MYEKGIHINIAVYPQTVVLKRAITLSRELRAKQGLFALNKTDHIPHITFYTATFPKKNVGAILDTIHKLVRKTSPFTMAATAYRQTKNNYVEVNYRKTKQISRFQKNIIQSVNPLRGDLPYQPTGLRYTEAEKQNLKRYGYDRVFKQFGPHLSISRLSAASPRIDTYAFPPVKDFSFRTETLGVFLVGEYYTAEKVIGRFTL